MDVNELDKLPDNRKSGFWKMSWFEVTYRFGFWCLVVYLHETGLINPHHKDFIFSDFHMPKITYDPFPENKDYIANYSDQGFDEGTGID